MWSDAVETLHELVLQLYWLNAKGILKIVRVIPFLKEFLLLSRVRQNGQKSLFSYCVTKIREKVGVSVHFMMRYIECDQPVKFQTD